MYPFTAHRYWSDAHSPFIWDILSMSQIKQLMRHCLNNISGHNKVLPCSLMASLNDILQVAREFSAPRTEEVSTQEVFTHRATVRLHGLSSSSSWRLGSVSTNQTSPWPTSLLWNRNRKAAKDTKERNYLETGAQNDLEKRLKETPHDNSLQSTN